jgi:hypothetical protein
MGYGLDDRDSIPGGARDFTLLHSVHSGSGAYIASYPVGTMGSVSLKEKRPGP